MILNRITYNDGVKKLTSDKKKFEKLKTDPTLNREKKLKEFLAELKAKKADFTNTFSGQI